MRTLTIAADGNTVSVSTFVALNTSDYEIADLTTLMLKRKP